ncbi:hypothetical protein ACP70R_003800 [Stipagrostis hirtigluma subsp. patula]
MPHRRDSSKAPMASGGDPFGALPDAVVQQVLGFLPARDTVRTCVLAQRWRPLWRSVPRLRITNVEARGCTWTLDRFVNRVLLLREPGCPLDKCEFNLRGFPHLDRACVDQWVRHALMCHVRVLQVRLCAEERIELADWPLFSEHLVRLELEGVVLGGSFVDFSTCPVLEDLNITNCLIDTDKIFSQSLKHLSITSCELCWRSVPMHVSAPNLISLRLDDYVGVTPILESMSSLENASVKLGHNNEEYCDFCDKDSSGDCTCGMSLINYANGSRNGDVSVLLGGLSSAAHLELKASPGMVTFKRDLKYCPIFSKLKTLVLTDWCLVDLHTLVCFLQHTPILEKLILKLSKKPKTADEMEGNYLMEQSLTLRQLKSVELKCQIIDGRVDNILEILRSCSIDLKNIIVQEI